MATQRHATQRHQHKSAQTHTARRGNVQRILINQLSVPSSGIITDTGLLLYDQLFREKISMKHYRSKFKLTG